MGKHEKGDLMDREEFLELCRENKTAALLELWDRIEASELVQAILMGAVDEAATVTE